MTQRIEKLRRLKQNNDLMAMAYSTQLNSQVNYSQLHDEALQKEMIRREREKRLALEQARRDSYIPGGVGFEGLTTDSRGKPIGLLDPRDVVDGKDGFDDDIVLTKFKMKAGQFTPQ